MVRSHSLRTIVLIVLVSAPPLATAQPPGGPPGGPGGFPGGPMGGPELELIDRFDADGDGRLDRQERALAREAAREERPARGRGPGGPPGGPGGPGRGPAGFGGGRPPAAPGPRMTPADVPAHPDADLYDLSVLRTLFLEFDGDDWEQELSDFRPTDVDVPAKLSVDGHTIEGVGVHFRGASSYFMVGEGYKRSLNLSIDHGDERARLHGYRTLNLLNANGDPSMMSSVLYAHIARPHLPTPKANFVRVVINGECWGVYVNVQQANKDFLDENYGSAKGNRWKVKGRPGGRGGLEYFGADTEPYRGIFELKTKENDDAWRDLIALCRIFEETPLGKLEEKVRPVLDVDEALWFLAIDNALVNSDGYWTRASDYTLFEDAGRVFHVIPHDMNECFIAGGPPGGGPPGGPGGGRGGPGHGGPDLDPLVALDDGGKPLRSGLLGVPRLRDRYLDHVRTIARDQLAWESIGPVIEQCRTLILDAVRNDTRKLASTEAFEAATSSTPTAGEGDRPVSLRDFIERRRAFLLRGDDPVSAR